MMARRTAMASSSPSPSSSGFHYELVHEASTALIRAGTEIYAFGDLEDAHIYFDASHSLLVHGGASCDPNSATSTTADHKDNRSLRIIELAKQKLEQSRALKSAHQAGAATVRFAPHWSCPSNRRNIDHQGEPLAKKTRCCAYLPDLGLPPHLPLAATAGSILVPPSAAKKAGTTATNTSSKKAGQKQLLPDLYEAGQCDVGPRMLNAPICPTSDLFYQPGTTGPTAISTFLQAVILFNKGLVCHNTTTTTTTTNISDSLTDSKLEDNGQPHTTTTTTTALHLVMAEQHYNAVSTHATLLLSDVAAFCPFHNAVTELAMRACNNLGVLYYRNNDQLAEQAFGAAIRFAKQLAMINPLQYNLEYATILSNYCRIQFLRSIRGTGLLTRTTTTPYGGVATMLLHHAQEVLRLRRTCLPLEHADVAAAIWNVGAILYHHTADMKHATFHLMQYLGIASRRTLVSENNLVELDAVPALVLLLMIQNKDRAVHDPLAQELLVGLSNLTDKRSEEGRGSAEVASILNYLGTILFHQQEYHHSLVFFLEELRLEDQKQEEGHGGSDSAAHHSSSSSAAGSPNVISVTCNNVGRIMQELGRYKEAVFFYERSLREWYGNLENGTSWIIRKNDIASQIQYSKDKIEATSKSNKNAVINLYSTVWYNLGLISDKVGSFDDAMYAFEMALALRQLMVGRHHADVACLLYNIGVLQMEKHRLDEASRSLIQALRIRNNGDAGQLSDEHLVRTLQKLAALLRKDDHLEKALDTYLEITVIHESSSGGSNGNNNTTNHHCDDALLLEAGRAWHAIAEIHHVRNNLSDAVQAADRSIVCLRTFYNNIKISINDPIMMLTPSNAVSASTSLLLVAEQLVGCLLLQASLYHELAEPIFARQYVSEAAELARQLGSANIAGLASLTALTELTTLLERGQCAAVA